jgi:hypothetical protein
MWGKFPFPFKAWPGAQCNAVLRCNKGLCAVPGCRAVISRPLAQAPRIRRRLPRHAPSDPLFQRLPKPPRSPELALPALILIIAAFALAWQFVRPAPPKRIVMSTGAAGGAYHYFGERYREKLAQDGIEVELRPSSGAVENLRRLKTDDSVDVGFIQGGIANEPESEDLATLGSMYLEPVWVFYRGPADLDRVAQLKGRRIAVGLPGSGAQLFALQLLAANGFATNDPNLRPHRRHGRGRRPQARRGGCLLRGGRTPGAGGERPAPHRRHQACSTSPRPTAT